MQALRRRHIRSGKQFDKLIPKSISKDSVVKPAGKAKLHHTINLIKKIVPETKRDTQLLANYLKDRDLRMTCKNIWDFVYNHIQYSRDKAGIEQVRRPSRTWADRKHGVDCDCYSVFISSILTNLGIPHKLRITKYGGKSHFQHIYPIVPLGTNAYITLDCVTDQFDYEVPFSGVKDFDVFDPSPVGDINDATTVSGVDLLDLANDGVGRIGRGRLPLRRTQMKDIIPPKSLPVKSKSRSPIKPSVATAQPHSENRKMAAQQVNVVRAQDKGGFISSTKKIRVGIAGKVLVAIGVGFGTYKLAELFSTS
ncbi:MAG: hypothetical protein AAGA02_00175 [Bacteroidota bacterium]